MTPAESRVISAAVAWADREPCMAQAVSNLLAATRALAVEREQAAEIVRFRNVPGVGETKEKTL